jgi:hypothetical protein
MEIIGRNPNPDKYSIGQVKVDFGATAVQLSPGSKEQGRKRHERTVIESVRLFVDLEPKPYDRERGFGSSYERKRNACTLRIEIEELEQIQEALRLELQKVYQFIYDKDLFGAFKRHQEEFDSWPPETDVPDKNSAA